jgi:hypothetical protein
MGLSKMAKSSNFAFELSEYLLNELPWHLDLKI